MVRIRLRRMGTVRKPTWRVVVADSRSPRDGRFVEQIGTYDARANPPKISVNAERYHHWVAKGAQPSETVKSLVKKASAK